MNPLRVNKPRSMIPVSTLRQRFIGDKSMRPFSTATQRGYKGARRSVARYEKIDFRKPLRFDWKFKSFAIPSRRSMPMDMAPTLSRRLSSREGHKEAHGP